MNQFGVIIDLALVVIGCICIILTFNIIKKPKNKETTSTEPDVPQKQYQALPFLLTKTELQFFQQLRDATPLVYDIHSKVRMADICQSIDRKNKSNFNKISRKHFDFVITLRESSKVIGVIELDDKSHNTASAKRNDSFKNDTLNEAEITLIRVKVSQDYSEDLKKIGITLFS